MVDRRRVTIDLDSGTLPGVVESRVQVLASGVVSGKLDSSQLSTDATLGGGTPSATKLPAETAVKSYVDGRFTALTSAGVSDFKTAARSNMGGINGHMYNLTSSNFRKWKKAKQKARAGTANAKILCVGDSNMSGYGGSLMNTYQPFTAIPHFLTTQLDEKDIAVDGLGIVIGGGVGGAWHDNRFTITGWGDNAALAYFGWGGGSIRGFQASDAPGETIVYAPGISADTFDVYYIDGPASAGFTVQATGGSTTTIANGSGTLASTSIKKTTVTAASVGTGNTVTITSNASAAPAKMSYIIGVEASLSTKKQILIGNAGALGATAQSWAGVNATFPLVSPKKAIEAYAPDLTIIQLGGNDAGVPRSDAQFLADLNSIITSARVTGDVLILTYFPVGSTYASRDPIIAGYVTAMIADGTPLVDTHGYLPNYTSYSAAGFMYADGVHGNDYSFDELAGFAAAALNSV
jgi:lysophospholipase L1-like esterase